MRSLARVTAAALLATTLLGTTALSAEAAIPKGSLAEVIFETGSKGPLGDPGYAVVKGWWGHEGAAHTGATYFSVNAADSSGVVNAASAAIVNRALKDGGSFDSLRVAFVPASSDGSTERPFVHAGESAGQAFKWWTDMGMGSSVAGSRAANDSGTFVSTQAQWDKFWHAGRPVQAFDAHLVLHDVSNGAVSTTPEGTSILSAWPAGTKISVVLYVSDGYNDELEPKIKVGPDGRALSAWLTIRTIAKPGDPVRTSAGYQVLTASPGEGSKLVNGMPPASADYNAHASSSPSASPTAGPTKASTGPQTQASGQHASSAKSGFSKVAGSAWTWVVLVLLALAGGSALAFRRLFGR